MMTISAYHPFRSEEAKTAYLSRYDAMAQTWPIPSESKMVDSSYGQTFIRISGPVHAPPLVLLPGAGTTSLQWMLNIEALSIHFRTYAVDSLINLGCVGRSTYTKPISSAKEAMQWLDELFNGLSLQDNIHLLGASYGGWLASQYALHAPERLHKVVLVAPAGMVLPFRGAYLLRTILLSIFPRRNAYIRFFKYSFKDLAEKDSQFVEEMADDFLASTQCFEPMNPKQLPRLTSLSDEELQSFQVPTFFVIGENDVLYSAQKAIQRLNGIAPQIQTEVIPNAGHDLLIVQTEMVNDKIVAFLEN